MKDATRSAWLATSASSHSADSVRISSPEPIAGSYLLAFGAGRGSAAPGRCGRGEEVDEQPGDAFGLVVVHPVRGVGQALDTVQVGHVVVLRLGQVRAEVTVALAPDDQRRRL